MIEARKKRLDYYPIWSYIHSGPHVRR